MIEEILSLSPILLAVVAAALLFDFVNGWNDSANAIATVVSTRVLTPLKALALASVLNMVGAMAGTAVAKTIVTGLVRTGEGFLQPEMVILVVLSAMIGAIIWAAWMTLIGMPISGSHSLVGGLVGASVAAAGVKVLIGSGIIKILLAMLLSPLLGGLVGCGTILVLIQIFKNSRPVFVSKLFSLLQIVSAGFMSFTHGLNDAQKVMGIITMALIAGKVQAVGPNGEVDPELWVKLSCGLMIALGTAIGGWKVIRTLGVSLSKLRPIDGFAAETAAGIVLTGAAALGVPVSTTHTITGGIMGVGASKGLSSVRWIVGQKIILAWIFTLPATSLLAGAVYWILAVRMGLI
jgi:PiT family inorganic phosphate transporter